jgi:3-oxoisoapionate decarboxylase
MEQMTDSFVRDPKHHLNRPDTNETPAMQLAIDSYCYHRHFGEIYPGSETDPGTRMTMDDFLAHAHALGVAGVSLESCFFAQTDAATLARLRDRLDLLGLDRVWAWGHPHGLRSGDDPAAADDLVRHIGIAQAVGAKVMRICCGGRRTRPASWAEHRAKLLPLLNRVVGLAGEHGVVLAIENHIDLLADELVELIETVNSPWLGVCLDTANNLRMMEDPVEAARKLAPYARATHIKDIAANTATKHGNPRDFAFWPSVPVGEGVIDMAAIFGFLREARYDGLLALEIDYLHPAYMVDGNADAAIAQSLQAMRGLIPPPPALHTAPP